MQNLLVGLEEMDWSPNCGLTCKPTYVGRNVWVYKYKPMPISLFKSKSKLGLDSKRKLASMVGLDVGPGSPGTDPQPNSGPPKRTLEEGLDGMPSVFVGADVRSFGYFW